MFDKDYDIRGKHASHVKYLVNDAKVFKRYIDVYMVGSVMGMLHGRKATRDSSISDGANILAGAFNTERLKCEFLYRLLMLLDEKQGLTEEQRIDRAFRVDDSTPDRLKDNMDLFHSYVFGGIEVLHEKFQDCTTTDDYMTKIHEEVSSFNIDVEGSSYDDLIKTFV